jgi:hypothetical protein
MWARINPNPSIDETSEVLRQLAKDRRKTSKKYAGIRNARARNDPVEDAMLRDAYASALKVEEIEGRRTLKEDARREKARLEEVAEQRREAKIVEQAAQTFQRPRQRKQVARENRMTAVLADGGRAELQRTSDIVAQQAAQDLEDKELGTAGSAKKAGEGLPHEEKPADGGGAAADPWFELDLVWNRADEMVTDGNYVEALLIFKEMLTWLKTLDSEVKDRPDMEDAVKERTHNLESRLAEVGSMWVAAVHGAGGIQQWLAGTDALVAPLAYAHTHLTPRSPEEAEGSSQPSLAPLAPLPRRPSMADPPPRVASSSTGLHPNPPRRSSPPTGRAGAGAVAAMSTANQRPEAPAFQMERNPLSAGTEEESEESVAEEEALDKEAVQVAWEEDRKKAKVAKKAAKKAAKEAQGAAREAARANRGH